MLKVKQVPQGRHKHRLGMSVEKRTVEPRRVDRNLELTALTTLHWGIKQSLLAYLRGHARGTAMASGYASEDEAGAFQFPCSLVSDSRLEFRGAVALWGHGGLVDVSLTDPLLIRGPNSWILAVTVGNQLLDLAEISRFVPAGNCLEAAETRLTSLGARLFQDQYPVGTLLDNPVVHT